MNLQIKNMAFLDAVSVQFSYLYPNQGADYAHHITTCPPGFENLTASLQCMFTVVLTSK